MTSPAATPVLSLLTELIKHPSVTPDDHGCQEFISHYLSELGFTPQDLSADDVTNSWVRRGDTAPLFVFAGHTDVVPPGDTTQWASDPFQAEVRNGMVYGRGAADMKGGIAAMMVAVRELITQHPNHKGSIAFLLTSNEEGITQYGTGYAVEKLQAQGDHIDWCIVGEPSSTATLGDTVKHGRRGSITARLTVHGKQGHVAYPDLADNPIHRIAPVLATLCQKQWDNGNDDFPPTSFQICEIQSGVGADNVIPPQIEVTFNLRYSTELTQEAIQEQVESILQSEGLNYDIEWVPSAQPFLSAKGELHNTVSTVIEEFTGKAPAFSTGGGTSDARFIAPTGTQTIELGVTNETIHMVDECTRVEDLEQLAKIYQRILERLLT